MSRAEPERRLAWRVWAAYALTSLALILCALVSGPGSALAQDGDQMVRLDGNPAVISISSKFVAIAPPRPDPSGGGRIAAPEKRVYPAESPFPGWSSITLRNDSEATIERLMVFTYPALDRTGLLGAPFGEPRIINIRHAEGQMPLVIPASGLANRVAMLGIRLAPGESHVLALQIEGGNRSLGVHLWEPGALQRYDTFLLLMIGVFWGVLLVGISLMFAMRLMGDRGGMLAGGFFALFALLFESAAFGFAGASADWMRLLGGEAAIGILRSASLVLVSAFGLSFLRKLLNLREEAPYADLALRITQYAIVLLLVLVFMPGLGAVAARAAALTAILASGYIVWQLRAFLPSALRLVPPGWSLIVLAAVIAEILSLSGLGTVALVVEPIVHGLFVIGITLLVLAAAVQATQGAAGFAPEPAFAPTFAQPPRPAPIATAAGTGASQARGHQGLWDWRVGENKLYVSPAVESLMGLAEGTLGKSESAWSERIIDADRAVYRDSLKHYVDQGNSTFALEFRVHTEEGGQRWVQLRATGLAGDDGRAARVIGLVTDITAAKEIEEQLVREASHDTLTGVGNRALMLSHLDWALSNADKHKTIDSATGEPLRPALIVLDIDRFRTVNDGLGHAAGDKLLIQIARRIERAIGPHDIVARIGSDEFAVLLLPPAAGETATAKMSDSDEMAALIADLISQPLVLDGQTFYPTASFGIARFDDRHNRAQDVLADAEVALRQAKKRGGGEVEIFEAKQRKASGAALSLEADMRQALQKEQMQVLYQPIMRTHDSAVAGFEALLRWKHPDKGLLTPKDFVPIAEETGMIVTLGRYVLSMAALQLQQWQTYFPLQPPLFMTVNVSSRQLLKPNFVRDVAEIVGSASLAPGTLKLEVTESMVFEDEERVAALLGDLKRTGVNLVLDDFGTGYSSLTRLKAAPFSTVKIERAFTAAIGDKGQSDAIVRSTIQMAHDMGLDVVAEGVERDDQLRALSALGCEYVQGYLFGKPIGVEAASNFIALNWRVPA